MSVQIVPMDVFRGRVLGAGAFGTVSAVLVRRDFRQFVLKEPGDGDHEDILYELRVLQNIGFHYNVTALEFFYNTGNRIGLIFERGICNLWDLASKCEITEDEIRGIFLNMHSALKYLHSKGFLHCDVKPDNIIVYHDGTVKLADFGCAVEIQGTKTLNTCTGTTPYMAPAILAQHKYVDRTIDFWSLAVTCLEVFFHCLPFDGWTRQEVYSNIVCRQLFTASPKKINWALWDTGMFFVPRLSLQPPRREPGTSIIDDPYFELGCADLTRPIRLMYGSRKRRIPFVPRRDSERTTVSGKKLKVN